MGSTKPLAEVGVAVGAGSTKPVAGVWLEPGAEVAEPAVAVGVREGGRRTSRLVRARWLAEAVGEAAASRGCQDREFVVRMGTLGILPPLWRMSHPAC